MHLCSTLSMERISTVSHITMYYYSLMIYYHHSLQLLSMIIIIILFLLINSHDRRVHIIMKATKVQTLGGRAVAGEWLVAWAIMAMGAIINTHAHR